MMHCNLCQWVEGDQQLCIQYKIWSLGTLERLYTGRDREFERLKSDL